MTVYEQVVSSAAVICFLHVCVCMCVCVFNGRLAHVQQYSLITSTAAGNSNRNPSFSGYNWFSRRGGGGGKVTIAQASSSLI